MSDVLRGEVTRLLREIADGNPAAKDDLVAVIYSDLHQTAERLMRGERPGHTLQPTALVHEAILRLFGSQVILEAGNRSMLFHAATRAMRQVLVDHARRRRAAKRGGDWKRTSLDDAIDLFEKEHLQLDELDRALNKLERLSPRQHQVIELRFFGGLPVSQIAEILNISQSSVEKDLQRARAFLYGQVENG